MLHRDRVSKSSDVLARRSKLSSKEVLELGFTMNSDVRKGETHKVEQRDVLRPGELALFGAPSASYQSVHDEYVVPSPWPKGESFGLSGSFSGHMSSRGPNLQNISRRPRGNIAADFSVAASTGDIRYKGRGDKYSVLELHRYLQDLADEPPVDGGDLVDITSSNPSERCTDTLIALNAPFNIDARTAQYLRDGSITQDGGNTLYTGVVDFGEMAQRALMNEMDYHDILDWSAKKTRENAKTINFAMAYGASPERAAEAIYQAVYSGNKTGTRFLEEQYFGKSKYNIAAPTITTRDRKAYEHDVVQLLQKKAVQEMCEQEDNEFFKMLKRYAEWDTRMTNDLYDKLGAIYAQ